MGEYEVIYRKRSKRFIEPFDKTPLGIVCRPFYKLTFAWGCPFACDYCYLRGTFFQAKWLGRKVTIYTNMDDMLREVNHFLRDRTIKPTVLHTGELTDSLGIPEFSKILAPVIEKFAKQDRHKLLLLTKSGNVDDILDVEHGDQTVVGFSLNPPIIQHLYEHYTATTPERTLAIEKCIEAGYLTYVRIDPVIPIDGWEEYYYPLIEFVNSLSDRRELIGVTVGTIRAYSRLKRILRSDLKNMLTERDVGNRWRLPENLRLKIYEYFMSRIAHPRVGVCKEEGRIWAILYRKFGKKFICNCSVNV